MAKSAYDAALILSIISGQDPLDNKSIHQMFKLTQLQTLILRITPNSPKMHPSLASAWGYRELSFSTKPMSAIRKSSMR